MFNHCNCPFEGTFNQVTPSCNPQKVTLEIPFLFFVFALRKSISKVSLYDSFNFSGFFASALDIEAISISVMWTSNPFAIYILIVFSYSAIVGFPCLMWDCIPKTSIRVGNFESFSWAFTESIIFKIIARLLDIHSL